MDSIENFRQFRRQSKKGILVIYLNLLYKTLKAFWLLLIIFIQKFSNISETTIFYIYLGVAGLLFFFLIRAYFIFINFQFKIENQHFKYAPARIDCVATKQQKRRTMKAP